MAKLEFDAQCRVAVDSDTVMRALIAVDRLPEWSGIHRSIAVEATDELGRPVRARGQVAVFGFADDHRYTYEWSEDRMVWTTVESKFVSTNGGAYTLRPDGDGTAIDVYYEVEPKVPVPGFVFRAAEKRAADSLCKNLVVFIERFAAESAADGTAGG